MYKIHKIRLQRILSMIGAVTMLLIINACQSDNKQSNKNDLFSNDGTTFAGNNPFANSTEAATANIPGGAHFVCLNNCEGSGSNEAGICPICGEGLVHNDAFHAGENQNNTTITQNFDDNTSNTFTLPNNTSASQSTNGAFHYTCSDNCGSGSDSAGNCPNCGAPLVHNDAYHQQPANNTAATATQMTAPTNQNVKYPSIFNTPNAPSASVPNQVGNGFHYICSAGCGGGGEAPGSCPNCGNPLTHNDSYHL